MPVLIAWSFIMITYVFCFVTVTSQVAVLPPSSVVTVIVAVPSATPVTLPELSTVAIDGALLSQVIFLLPALSGSTVADSFIVPPMFTSIESLSKVTPVTLAGAVYSSKSLILAALVEALEAVAEKVLLLKAM